MSDIRIKYFLDSQEFDADLKNWELEYDDGLETAVLISLFSDRLVSSEELPIGDTSKRGFWGDAVDNEENSLTGSKLWLMDRQKVTDELLEQAMEWCEEALQWLLDDLIAEEVNVETSYLDKQSIQISIEIVRPKQGRVNYKFSYVWDNRGARVDQNYI